MFCRLSRQHHVPREENWRHRRWYRRTNTAAIAGTWKFEPADENAMVKVQDSDHLSFGYWLSKTPAKVPVGFGVWYAGSKAVAADMDIQELDEKVTYTGAAAGKYVIQSDVPNFAHAGYFTASAELEADFTAEAGTYGMVEGTISGFKDGEYTRWVIWS